MFFIWTANNYTDKVEIIWDKVNRPAVIQTVLVRDIKSSFPAAMNITQDAT